MIVASSISTRSRLDAGFEKMVLMLCWDEKITGGTGGRGRESSQMVGKLLGSLLRLDTIFHFFKERLLFLKHK